MPSFFRRPDDRQPRARRLWPAAGLLALVALALVAATGAAAAAESERVSAIKAAFVFNFGKFTQWPRSRFQGPSDAVVLCVQSDALSGGALAPLRKKTIRDRPIRIRRFERLPVNAPCHILYVGQGAPAGTISDVIAYGRQESMLTVSDAEEFAERGGHIELFEMSGRLRFKVNLAAARASDLQLSSKLLKLAVVLGEPE